MTTVSTDPIAGDERPRTRAGSYLKCDVQPDALAEPSGSTGEGWAGLYTARSPTRSGVAFRPSSRRFFSAERIGPTPNAAFIVMARF